MLMHYAFTPNSVFKWVLPNGLWRQHELWDGTYTLDDLLDAVEVIRVRRENERRAAEAAQG